MHQERELKDTKNLCILFIIKSVCRPRAVMFTSETRRTCLLWARDIRLPRIQNTAHGKARRRGRQSNEIDTYHPTYGCIPTTSCYQLCGGQLNSERLLTLAWACLATLSVIAPQRQDPFAPSRDSATANLSKIPSKIVFPPSLAMSARACCSRERITRSVYSNERVESLKYATIWCFSVGVLGRF